VTNRFTEIDYHDRLPVASINFPIRSNQNDYGTLLACLGKAHHIDRIFAKAKPVSAPMRAGNSEVRSTNIDTEMIITDRAWHSIKSSHLPKPELNSGFYCLLE